MTTGPDHDRWEDAAGAYLLGALPEDEHRAYEGHLAVCVACRDEVADLAVAADALPASVVQLVPPPELKMRIMVEVEREAELLAAAGPEADRAPRAPRKSRRSWLGLPRAATLAGAAALAAGVLVGVSVDGLVQGDGVRTVTAIRDTAQAPRVRAEVEIRDGRMTLVAQGLPAPPAGRVYQVWLKRPGQPPEPTSALFLPSRDGTATTAVPGDADGLEQVMVTHEPAGGSAVPSRDPVLTARMAS